MSAHAVKVEDQEEARFRAFAEEIRASQRRISKAHPLRGFHAKMHAGVMAEFQVLENLPDRARYGVFRLPGTFPAAVRFSNGLQTMGADKSPQPRGIAIKVVGVDGPKVPEHRDEVTQDFLATSHSVTSAVRNADQFMAFVRAHERGLRGPGFPYLCREVGVREAVRICWSLLRIGLSRVRSMATERFSSTAPISMGPHAVKFTLQPADGVEASPGVAMTEDFLHEDLARRLRAGAVEFDFLVQFFVDDSRTPIDDTSVSWDPKVAPMLKVARLRIPKVDIDDPPGLAMSQAVGRLSFSPWHALVDHQPLGSVMRARRVAYKASSELRGGTPEPRRLPL